MNIKAYAKINLSLDVTGKREDGYHLLKMVMQSIDLYDEIKVELIPKGIDLSCNLPFVPVNGKNIAHKAASAFMKRIGMSHGVRIHIEKRIPVAGGLAGGSSNAGAVLRALNELTGQPLTFQELLDLGLSLGADVPFTMTGGTALCEGIGEIITPLTDFSGHWLVLVKPPFGVSTRQIFSAFKINRVHRHPRTGRLIQGIDSGDLKMVAQNLGNVLENVTFQRRPVLRKIKQDLLLEGALGSLMSGSGPTVFGAFESEATARSAYAAFKKKYAETFLVQTISKDGLFSSF